jgi:antitoxin component YwqK of YwqJK toxin-antitoxin module
MEKNKYNTEGNREGYWEYYHNNGTIWFKGNFINGIRIGYWEEYFNNGKMYSKEYFYI